MKRTELLYDFHRIGGTEKAKEAKEAVEVLLKLGVVEDCLLDRELWQDVGVMKSALRRVSLADCIGICLAKRLGLQEMELIR